MYDPHKKECKYRILGLTTVEQQTFDALHHQLALRVSSIVRRAKLPRTSAAVALERLHERGLVRIVNDRKVRFYGRAPAKALSRLLITTAADLGIPLALQEDRGVR